MTVTEHNNPTTDAGSRQGPPARGRIGRSLARSATRLQRRVFNSGSGVALLWVGWALMVFYAVLWFTAGEIDPDIRRWQSFVVMALLAQSAIVTGVGLAVLDVVSARPKARVPLKQEPLAVTAVAPPHTPPMPARVSVMRTVPAKGVSARAARLFSDGSIEIETKLGRRRFLTPADAIKFVGPSAVAASSLH